MEKSLIRETSGDRLFTIINYSLLTLFTITILYPLIYVVSASFSSSQAVMSGRVWLWPVEPTLEGYKAVFGYKMVWSGFANSIFYTVVGTIINVIFTMLAAYPLARSDFFGKNFMMMLFVFTTMFSGGIIPSYLLVKDLGLLDTRWALILPGALVIWNVIITRTYLKTTIPQEMLEAAQLDGCNDFNYFTRIVLPLSGPIIAVITLYYAVGHWNQFFNAMIYLSSKDKYPLQLVLRDILVQNEVDLEMLSNAKEAAAREGLRELLKYSLIVVSTIPILIIYPFVQKHFVKGIMIGSLKG